MDAQTVHHVDDAALIATQRNLVVGVWWRSARVVHVDAFRASTSGVLARHAGFATALVVMEGDGVFSFTEDVRRGATELVRETESSGVGTALVVLRRGFIGAAVRAFISGVFLLARSKEPQRAFADVRTAAAWLAGCLLASEPHSGWTAEALEDGLREALALADAARVRAAK